MRASRLSVRAMGVPEIVSLEPNGRETVASAGRRRPPRRTLRRRAWLWLVALAVMATGIFGVAVAFAEEPASASDAVDDAAGDPAAERITAFTFDGDDPAGLVYDEVAEVAFSVTLGNLVTSGNYALTATLITSDGEPLAIDDAPLAPQVETFQADETTRDLHFSIPIEAAALPDECEVGVACELSRDDETVMTWKSTDRSDDQAGTLTLLKPMLSISFDSTQTEGGEKMLVAARNASVAISPDTLRIPPHRTYALRVELIDASNAQTLVAAGLAQSSELTVEAPTTTAAVPFTFDATALGGMQIGARASLLDGDRLVAEATTAPDDALTVVAPTFRSTLADAVDGDDTLTIDPDMELIDSIAYDHLDPSTSYRVLSLLMDAATLRPLIVGSAEQAPDETELTEFFVALMEDYGLRQTAMVEPAAEGEPTTTLEVPAPIDQEALDGLLEENGELIASLGLRETELQPPSASGTLDVNLAFDGARFGRDGLPVAVTTCTLLTDGESVLAAALTGEGGRTVTLAPATLSGALAPTDAALTAIEATGATVELVNTVGFEGLVPERDYSLRTVLVDEDTGEDVLIDGEPVEATSAFTPSESSGTQPMTIALTPETLSGQTLGAREELYREETLVARGGDGEKGVPVVDPTGDGKEPASAPEDEGSTFAKTGFAALPWAIGACAAGGGAAALAGWRLQRRRWRW